MIQDNESKQCVSCKTYKEIKDFYKIKEKVDYYCKYCRNANSIKGQFNNKKQCSLNNCQNPNYANNLCRVHYARKERTGIVDREQTDIGKKYEYESGTYYYKQHRITHLRNRYNLTIEEFEKMAVNGCWLCGAKNSGVKRLHVEHDHKCCGPKKSCGKCIRGIVCNKCNILIGKYETKKMRDDNPHKDKVIQYLLNHRAKRSLRNRLFDIIGL